MDKDRLFIAQLEDRFNRADSRYMMVSGDFMDAHQKKLASDFMRQMKIPCAADTGDDYPGLRYMFFGGYEGAERTIPVFLPDYCDPAEVVSLLSAVRVTAPKGGRKLSHRDYLGALMGLGIDREVTGDIIVRDEESTEGPGADIILLSEMADFILLNYSKAGRAELKPEVIPLDEISESNVNLTYRTDTVASLRLDSVLASGFGMSRAKAAEAIRAGLVSVNGMEVIKVDAEVEEKDRITLRGKGRMILEEVGNRSRKGRIFIRTGI